MFHVISPYKEALAYEKLWNIKGMSFKKIRKAFAHGALPTEVWQSRNQEKEFDFHDGPSPTDTIDAYLRRELKEGNYSLILRKTYQYTAKMEETSLPLYYFQGNPDIAQREKIIAVVGARKISPEGERRTRKLSQKLAEEGFTLVSGLARGVDTIALETAIEMKAAVIGVIGTPISQYYPKENRNLQNHIAQKHLLLSHVPFYRYKHEAFRNRRF